MFQWQWQVTAQCEHRGAQVLSCQLLISTVCQFFCIF
uniref:Uncharacterized protein n=1 Tax=Anguilla anguilla TaxID=7936 RepID=A0A0E9SSN5_ANGAN